MEKLREMGTLEHGNESFNVHITLNLDWRIKAQRLRGIFDLPHSVGKPCLIAALTHDPELAEAALSAGASYAGDIEARILSNEMQWPKHFQRLVATDDMKHIVTGKGCKLARKLKRHKINPSPDDKTLVAPEDFVEAVRKHAGGYFIKYQNDLSGNVSVMIGKAALENHKLVENFDWVLRHLFATRPFEFGNGPYAKKKNLGKYVLGMHMVSSKTAALPLDLTTIDILNEMNQMEVNPKDPRWKKKKKTF
jgi:ribosomal protein L1